KFAPHEVIKYEKDMLTQWDIDEYVGEQVEKGVKEGHERGLREGMAKGLEEGMKEGRAEGREKGRKEALDNSLKAINLLKSGMKPGQVADKTSLSLDYVLEIQKELNG
ncbi:MAG: hypothetical protein MR294_06100, partial [Bacteroidales bacterium]|nr:hypothetical protein [Bacteroidales bacterium]